MDQCDLLVMGGYYGRGRARGVTHFLLGVLDEDATVVRSVARVGSGYSKQELFELMQKVTSIPAYLETNGLFYARLISICSI